MFTGIVEATGRVAVVEADPDGRRLRIEAPDLAADLTEGQSVSVNGACLTVEERGADWFLVFLAAETIARTALSELEPGDPVNLELAMPADGRFDGHLVQGHVDATTSVTDVEPVGEDWLFTFEIPAGYGRYLVEKGSVAIDGISLTIADRNEGTFSVAIVPTTYERTTLSDRGPGDLVHVEIDVLAKYVESMLESDETA